MKKEEGDGITTKILILIDCWRDYLAHLYHNSKSYKMICSIYLSHSNFFKNLVIEKNKDPHKQHWLKQCGLKKIYQIGPRMERVAPLIAGNPRPFALLCVKYHECDEEILLELFYSGS